jgi:hypothetical protein
VSSNINTSFSSDFWENISIYIIMSFSEQVNSHYAFIFIIFSQFSIFLNTWNTSPKKTYTMSCRKILEKKDSLLNILYILHDHNQDHCQLMPYSIGKKTHFFLSFVRCQSCYFMKLVTVTITPI